MKWALCTVISSNYLSFAKALASSFLTHHPDGVIWVLITDGTKGEKDASGRITYVTVEQIGVPNAASFCFRYGPAELCNALKPYLLTYAMKQHPDYRFLFLDADIYLYSPLQELEELVATHSIILTPHITSPLPQDQKIPSELDLIRAGTYNAGCIALRNDEHSKQFLRWWSDHLEHECMNDQKKGLFMDQKWLELVPGLFSGVHILRNKAYNAAYWNLHERKISRQDNQYYVNEQPLAFFHFSGYDYELQRVSHYQNRYKMTDSEDVRSLFEQYKRELQRFGYEQTFHEMNQTTIFDNGVAILPVVRKVYHAMEKTGHRYHNPFQTTGEDSFYQKLISYIDGTMIPWVFYILYSDHVSFKAAFQSYRKKEEPALLASLRMQFLHEYQCYVETPEAFTAGEKG
ncbi:glycosyltransferase [Fictibacillus macauensis ZFHKF-1]|uniref:Glycosyltransferase n=1 Tax=Fictibacillus macauensis ZFHKF-1 TaxID=1196324 RepID=I8AG47_9BACL|nr:hypothetical protein [Fictibacillus macauensis]EIT84617.1 glycosyltransferase [Fictibacillus macauensis ZFHKF-1]